MEFVSVKLAVNLAIIAMLILVCVVNRLRGYRERQNRRSMESHAESERLLDKKSRIREDCGARQA